METFRADAVTPRAKGAPDLLSVVCPAYNEAEALETFHDALSVVMDELSQSYEVVFVNDGSTDNTLSVMRGLRTAHPNTAIVDLSRNFGKEIALAAGLDAARGDAVVVIDADLQDPPDLIGAFIEGWREGYEVVYARRRIREGEGWLKKATASLFYKVMRGIGPVALPENVGDFRLMSRKAVDAVCSMRERHRFMKGVFAWIGFPTKCVEYDRAPRAIGKTKWDYFKLWNLSLEGLTSSTLAPLKLSTYLGFIVAVMAFIYGSFIIIKAILFGDPAPGFPTLATLILFLGGVQLIVLGVIGEYLGRVFNETKNRPLYFINDILPSEIKPEATAKRGAAAIGGPAA